MTAACNYGGKPNGKKVWRFEWRRPDGKLDTLTLGEYPDISLEAARKERAALRTTRAAGNDPKAEKAKQKRAMGENLFKDIALQWWERWKETVTETYAGQVWRVLEANVFPDLGKRPVATITAREIVETLSPMEARGALEYLRRAKQTVTQILTFALARGLVENNVAAGITGAFSTPKKNHFRALPSDGLQPLLDGIKSDRIDIITRMAILWQLLTLARPGEAASLRWEEIDMKEKLWRVPATR